MSVPSPRSLSGDENLFAHIIDLSLYGELGKARALYESFEFRVNRAVSAIAPDSSGSWNIPILAAGCQFLFGDQEKAEEVMLEYLARQLDPDHPDYHGGFMGREALSSLYCWPPMVVLLFMSSSPNDRLREECRRYLSIYVLLLSLGAWRSRHEGLPYSVFMAGARTDVSWLGNSSLAYFLMTALGLPVDLTRSMREYFEAWPARLVETLGESLARVFTAKEKQRLKAHIHRGSEGVWIARKLAEHGARLRTRFEFYRFRDGLVTVMSRNLHPSTPPICATVRTREGWDHLSPYPRGFRGHGVRAVGNHRVFVNLDAREIRSLTRATWAGAVPSGRVLDSGEVEVIRPMPKGEALFKISVGPDGVVFDGAAVGGEVHDDDRETDAEQPGSPFFVDVARRIHGPLTALNSDHQKLESGEDAFDLAWRRVRNMANTFEQMSEQRP